MRSARTPVWACVGACLCGPAWAMPLDGVCLWGGGWLALLGGSLPELTRGACVLQGLKRKRWTRTSEEPPALSTCTLHKREGLCNVHSCNVLLWSMRSGALPSPADCLALSVSQRARQLLQQSATRRIERERRHSRDGPANRSWQQTSPRVISAASGWSKASGRRTRRAFCPTAWASVLHDQALSRKMAPGEQALRQLVDG